MSLDSYRKLVETQREQARYFGDEPKVEVSKEHRRKQAPKVVTKTKHNKIQYSISNSKIILTVFFVAILLLAALKNPSKSEAKKDIHAMLIEVVQEKMQQNLSDKEKNSNDKIWSGFGLLIVEQMIDKLILTDVSNYVFFSTFEANLPNEDKTTLVIGVIIFGKTIPLMTNTDKLFE